MRLVQTLLGKMGIKLKSRQQRGEDAREWVYQGWEYKSKLEQSSALREPVFAAWRERDQRELEWQLSDRAAPALSETVSSYDTKVSHQTPIREKQTAVTSKQTAVTKREEQPETAPFKQGSLVRWAGKAAQFCVTWCGIGMAAVRDVVSGQAFNAPTDELLPA